MTVLTELSPREIAYEIKNTVKFSSDYSLHMDVMVYSARCIVGGHSFFSSITMHYTLVSSISNTLIQKDLLTKLFNVIAGLIEGKHEAETYSTTTITQGCSFGD